MADFKEIGGCDPMTNGKAWRKMTNPAVKIATQSAPKLNPRSPVCTQCARIPRRTAGPLRLGCSNSSKGEENSPTRTECCAKIRVLSTVRVTYCQSKQVIPTTISPDSRWLVTLDRLARREF